MPTRGPSIDRRTFVRSVAGSAAAWSMLPAETTARTPANAAQPATRPQPTPRTPRRIRIAVIGLNHGHINSMTSAVIRGGGELVWLYAKEPDLAKAFLERFPAARLARSEDEILGDASINAVLSASIPVERAPLGIRVMQAGKDFIVDKPGVTSLAQLAGAIF